MHSTLTGSKRCIAATVALLIALISSARSPAQATGPFEVINHAAAQSNVPMHHLRGNMYALEGSGGNITVLSGPDGKFLVDAGIALSRTRIRKDLADIGKQSVKYVVNTHWHWDHADGNGWLRDGGAAVIATPQTLKHLSESTRVDAWNHTFAPVPSNGRPTILITTEKTFDMDNEKIHVMPIQPSHTDGDIVVYFEKNNVIATGDVFWNGVYPFIDDQQGGGIDGTIAVDSRLIGMSDDQTVIVPGHGPVATRADLIAFRDMLKSTREKIVALKSKGLSVDEIIAAKPTAAYDARWGGSIINPATFVRVVYDGLK
ncbi:MBL fold metallo-hydrolase [Rhodanobacter spathiphylli]|uniref:Beta-lactamase-like protein n=1 Tax=Rhodanobacter spathiphylli B39 TaxID=1163407 RepID=I4W7D3_9GAMM|nr:MBL fold metallo-hydrolase [Rhodanobacter spathiphylli]EIL95374.1 Beta-lactamase-like protein [Rhodanobacter spathiphylli B39]